MDLITFCPTLVDILNFVEPNDVLTCKLLSRSFYDYIKRNHFYLPRSQRRMIITTFKTPRPSILDQVIAALPEPYRFTDEVWPECFAQIHVDGKKRSTVALLTMESSKMVHCPLNVSLFYKVYGIPSGQNPGNANWDDLVAANAIPDAEGDENKTFQTRFREALAQLFYRFVFESIEFTASCKMNTEWMNWTGEVFSGSRSRCRRLLVEGKPRKVEKLVRSLGCDTLAMSSFSNEATFKRYIGYILRWNFPLRIPISLHRFNSDSHLRTLLEKWDHGDVSFNGVELDCREQSNADFVWTDQRVDLILSRLRNSAIESVELSEDDKRKICVKRACDKRVLSIETSYEPQRGNTKCRLVFIKELTPK